MRGLCTVVGALLLPCALASQHELAGVEIRNVRLDTRNRVLSFSLTNNTEQWATAWAWRVESDAPEGVGIRWYDNYMDFELPGLSSRPPKVGQRLRPGETREFTDPLPDGASGISLVAVVFEDTTAAGEASFLNRLERRRQLDVEVRSRFLAEIVRIRQATNGARALQEAIDRFPSAPPYADEAQPRLRRQLENVQAQLSGGQSAAGLLALYENTARVQLERAKSQAHFKRLH